MRKVGAVHRSARGEGGRLAWVQAIEVNRPYLKVICATIALFGLTNCSTVSQHQFIQPTNDWQFHSGQLLYRTAKTSLIGDALVRFSKNGDFELTFSKGPGVPLLVWRQDSQCAEVKGAFARAGWAGPVARAPKQLQGWLGLRAAFLHAKDQRSLRYVGNGETFLFRF